MKESVPKTRLNVASTFEVRYIRFNDGFVVTETMVGAINEVLGDAKKKGKVINIAWVSD